LHQSEDVPHFAIVTLKTPFGEFHIKSQINTYEKRCAITFIPSYASEGGASHLKDGTLKIPAERSPSKPK